MKATTRAKRSLAAAAIALGGVGAGAAIAVTGPASAADAVGSTVSSTVSHVVQNADPSKPVRSDEQLLTGTTAEKVTAAVEAAYPDATIQRVETDSEGVYEAHVVTSDGQQQVVQVGKDFTVTGTQELGGGPRGVPDPTDDDGPDAQSGGTTTG